ncbi:MAG: MFS transporter, partial [Gemmataceae bacterium]
TAILAAGVGFAIRGGILDNWGREYGFSGEELGAITGAGFTSFCFGIIIGGVVADKIGYGRLVIAAFLFHLLSAVVTFSAPPAPATGTEASVIAANKALVYVVLFWGTFLFGLANGTLEAVANPLVATLFPQNRTHYLNILHASWPLGLVLGSATGWVLDDMVKLEWRYQLMLFLLPTLAYGIMFFGQTMPRSEASKSGLSLGQMFKDVGILGGLVVCALLALFSEGVLKDLLGLLKLDPNLIARITFIVAWGNALGLLLVIVVITRFSLGSLLLFMLFITHALVGAVELGTDAWIQNITGNLLTSEQGKILFVFTSMVMFLLRFCAEWIEKNLGLTPISILLCSALLACAGLLLTSYVESFLIALLALTVYGIGKTFFWPTMLAVASDRFPRTGAVAISIMGGIGMMSAGLLGSPGLGYAKDRFAAEALQAERPGLFEMYRAEKPSTFLFLPQTPAIDGKKLGEITKKLTEVREELAKEGITDPDQALAKLTEEERIVFQASITGDRRTLRADAAIPAVMAGIYFLLLVFFWRQGGYKVLNIDGTPKEKAHS